MQKFPLLATDYYYGINYFLIISSTPIPLASSCFSIQFKSSSRKTNYILFFFQMHLEENVSASLVHYYRCLFITCEIYIRRERNYFTNRNYIGINFDDSSIYQGSGNNSSLKSSEVLNRVPGNRSPVKWNLLFVVDHRTM